MSDHTTYCDLPLTGEAIIVRGPGDRVPSHGTHYLAQTFAYDICGATQTGEILPTQLLLPYVLSSVRAEDCAGWQRPVLAPLTGEIVELANSREDALRISLVGGLVRTKIIARWTHASPRDLLGNYVIIRGQNSAVLIAHLRKSSICVQAGDRVRAGDRLGSLGNSGNSSFPHVHIQAMDTHHLSRAKGMPLGFRCYEEWSGAAWSFREHGLPRRGTVVRRAG